MSVLVITTGGTIGALAHPDPKNPPKVVLMPPDGRDLVREVLEKEFASIPTRCISLEPSDSKLIDEKYRDGIVRLIIEAPESGAVLTHGTDTLLQSADFFYRAFQADLALKNKSLIITGAMTPLANGPESDGYRNLAFSLTQLNKNTAALAGKVSVVLCDFDERGAWQPRLYDYAPGVYEKFYNPGDARHSRLRLRG